MDEDSRIAEIRDILSYDNPRGPLDSEEGVAAVAALLAYAEERLRVNVGILSENASLKKRIAELERGV